MILALLSSFSAALVCAVVATWASLFRAGTVSPFRPTCPDPLDDTLNGDSAVRTAPPQEAPWRLAAFSGVRDAEEFLDRLEACGYREREFHTLDNSSFAVRWR